MALTNDNFTTNLEEQKKRLLNGTSPTQTTAPAQPFRDDLNKDKELASKERIATTSAIGDALKEASKTTSDNSKITSQSEPAPAFQAFQDVLNKQNPQFQQIQSATSSQIQKNLTGEPEGLGKSGDLAASDFARDMEAARLAEREQAIKTFGTGTGQVADANRTFNQRAILNSADFNSRLAAADEQARTAQSAQALNNAMGFLGQEGQRQLGQAQLAQQESQFQRAQIQEKEITNLSFDHDARIQANSQGFQAAQSELDRNLALLSQDKQIQAQQLLQSSDQSFQTQFQETGFINSQKMAEIDQAFQAKMQANGFDQETATLLTQLNHDRMESENNRQFSSEQAEIDRMWRSGERVSSEDFQKSIVSIEQAFASHENDLERTLRLDLQENQFSFENARTEAEQIYNDSVINKQMSHEEAMQASNQVFQSEMQQAGFSQDQILQGQRLTQEMAMFEKDIEMREAQFAVTTAMQDEQFMKQLGIEQQKVDLNREAIVEDIRQFDQTFGLQKEQWNKALESQEVQDKLQAASMAMELLPDDEEALKPFVESLFGAIGSQLGFSEGDIKTAIDSFGENADGGSSGVGSMIDSGNFSEIKPSQWLEISSDPEMMDKLKASTTTVSSDPKTGELFSGSTKSLAYINELGLKADTVDWVGEGEKGAGSGNGSVIVVDGRPARVVLIDSDKRTTGFPSRTERKAQIFAEYLDDNERILVGGTNGWTRA